jgi:predicted esterase
MLSSGPASAQRQASRYEINKLVDAYFKIEDAAELEALAHRLCELPPLSDKELAKWRKDLLKPSQKRRPLLNKSGNNYFYSKKERRGRYIIIGKGKKGLAIVMHGGGVGSGDAGGAASGFSAAMSRMGWVGICPEVLVKTEHGWSDSGTEEFVIELIEAGLRTFQVDPNRLFLTGHSMGGYGTWTLGAHHADRVAGLAAYAGAPTPYWNDKKEVVGIQDGVLPNLFTLPFHIYQSTDDQNVPYEVNHWAAAELGRLKEKYGGYNFIYQEVTGRGHGFPPGGPLPALEWVGKYDRDPRPKKIRWEPVLSWKKQFYWLRWENPEKGPIIEASIEDNNIKIETSKPAPGLKVLLDERLIDFQKEVVVTLNGKTSYRGSVEPQLFYLLRGARERYDPHSWYLAEVPVTEAEQ